MITTNLEDSLVCSLQNQIHTVSARGVTNQYTPVVVRANEPFPLNFPSIIVHFPQHDRVSQEFVGNVVGQFPNEESVDGDFIARGPFIYGYVVVSDVQITVICSDSASKGIDSARICKEIIDNLRQYICLNWRTYLTGIKGNIPMPLGPVMDRSRLVNKVWMNVFTFTLQIRHTFRYPLTQPDDPFIRDVNGYMRPYWGRDAGTITDLGYTDDGPTSWSVPFSVWYADGIKIVQDDKATEIASTLTDQWRDCLSNLDNADWDPVNGPIMHDDSEAGQTFTLLDEYEGFLKVGRMVDASPTNDSMMGYAWDVTGVGLASGTCYMITRVAQTDSQFVVLLFAPIGQANYIEYGANGNFWVDGGGFAQDTGVSYEADTWYTFKINWDNAGAGHFYAWVFINGAWVQLANDMPFMDSGIDPIMIFFWSLNPSLGTFYMAAVDSSDKAGYYEDRILNLISGTLTRNGNVPDSAHQIFIEHQPSLTGSKEYEQIDVHYTELTDSSASWVANQWANYRLEIIADDGTYKYFTIISNTTNKLIFNGSDLYDEADIGNTYTIVGFVFT